MGQIIIPEKVTLVVCPNDDNHQSLERVRFGKGKSSYVVYVFRAIHEVNLVKYTYLYPPFEFSMMLIGVARENNPGQPIPILYEECSVCRGLGLPKYSR